MGATNVAVARALTASPSGRPRSASSPEGRSSARIGLPERWAYRAAAQDNRIFGLPEKQVHRLWERATAPVNLTGATLLRDEHLRVPVRIFLETDPVLPQIEVAQGRQFTMDLLKAHAHLFSYGENFGAPDCRVPPGPFRYRNLGNLATIGRKEAVVDFGRLKLTGRIAGPGAHLFPDRLFATVWRSRSIGFGLT